MRTFTQYFEERENSIFSRVKSALRIFLENRQGLLQRIEVKLTPEQVAEPFGELTFQGADKDTLEHAIKRVEELATQMDRNAGSNLYEALSNLMHRADYLDNIRELDKALSWLPQMDEIRANQS